MKRSWNDHERLTKPHTSDSTNTPHTRTKRAGYADTRRGLKRCPNNSEPDCSDQEETEQQQTRELSTDVPQCAPQTDFQATREVAGSQAISRAAWSQRDHERGYKPAADGSGQDGTGTEKIFSDSQL